MNRCISITKNNTRCRAKTKDNLLFCCDNHKPLNKEIIDNGCFMCMEKIEKSNEIIFFKCKHAFHKPCYIEWLKYSTYETPICIICRNIIFNKSPQKIKRPLKFVSNSDPIDNILNTLEIKKIYCFNENFLKPYSEEYLPPNNYPSSPNYPPPDNYPSSPNYPPPDNYPSSPNYLHP